MQKELFPVVESYRTDFEGETKECRTCSVVKECTGEVCEIVDIN